VLAGRPPDVIARPVDALLAAIGAGRRHAA